MENKYKTLTILGGGWIEKYDEKYGRKFYYNRRSRRSTWSKPEVKLLPPGHDKGEEKGSSSEWEKRYSQTYNQSYYYNKLSQTSVWESPEVRAERKEENSMDSDSDLSNTNNQTFQAKFEYKPALSPTLNIVNTKSKRPAENLEAEYEVLCKYIDKINDRKDELPPEDFKEFETFAEDVKKKVSKINKSSPRAKSKTTKTRTRKVSSVSHPDVQIQSDEPPQLLLQNDSKTKHTPNKQDARALEADNKAREAAREKFEQIKLLKHGKGDYYKLLGLEKGATSGQLKKAYFKLMIRYHPDKQKRAAAGVEFEEDLTEKETTERSNLVKDAYKTLSDKWERSLYDFLGLESYLMHDKTLQAFINYIISGVRVKKHGRKDRRIGIGSIAKLSYYNARNRFLWLDHTHEHIHTGRARILEPVTKQEIKSIKPLALKDITEVKLGRNTDVFKRTGVKKDEEMYFSIISPERSMDIECNSKQQRDFLAARINLLRCCHQKDFDQVKKHYEQFPMRKIPKPPKKKKGKK